MSLIIPPTLHRHMNSKLDAWVDMQGEVPSLCCVATIFDVESQMPMPENAVCLVCNTEWTTEVYWKVKE